MGQKIDQTAKLEYETERGTFSRSFLQYLISFSICKGEQETAGKADFNFIHLSHSPLKILG